MIVVKILGAALFVNRQLPSRLVHKTRSASRRRREPSIQARLWLPDVSPKAYWSVQHTKTKA